MMPWLLSPHNSRIAVLQDVQSEAVTNSQQRFLDTRLPSPSKAVATTRRRENNGVTLKTVALSHAQATMARSLAMVTETWPFYSMRSRNGLTAETGNKV